MWFHQLSVASLVLFLRDEGSLVTKRYLSIIGLRILINKLKGHSPQRKVFVLVGKAAVVMNQPTPEAAKLLGTCCEWMTVLISFPSRGGMQPALLQTNFANHILWLNIGLLRPSHFGGQTSLA